MEKKDTTIKTSIDTRQAIKYQAVRENKTMMKLLQEIINNHIKNYDRVLKQQRKK